jgi:nucleoside-diphosphate-sugar epimerase
MSVLSPDNDSLYDDVQNMTPYAYSKFLAESYCLKAALPTISFVRFSTLFYQDPNKDGLSKLIYDAVVNKKITIYNGGEAKRNFLPLHVAAQYVNKIASNEANGKYVYNLCAPYAMSFMEIVNILKKYLPQFEIEDRIADVSRPILADFNKTAVEKLGGIDFTLEEYIVDYINKIQS